MDKNQIERDIAALRERWIFDDEGYAEADYEKSEHKYVLKIGLVANFFFEYNHKKDKEAVAWCLEQFQKLFAQHLTWQFKNQARRPTRYSKPIDFTEQLKLANDDNEFDWVFGSQSYSESDDYSLSILCTPNWNSTNLSSNLCLHIPYEFENITLIKEIFIRFSEKLKIKHAYAGLGTNLPYDTGYLWQPWEFECLTHYKGILPSSSASLNLALTNTTLSATWLLALNKQWFKDLGSNDTLSALGYDEIKVISYESGVIIELSEAPESLPIENPTPQKWIDYYKWLKPKIFQNFVSIHYANDNETLDHTNTKAWITRFDGHGEWPPSQEQYEKINDDFQRFKREQSVQPEIEGLSQPQTDSRYTGDSVAVGEVCQVTGLYEAPYLNNKVVMLYQGQKVAGDTHNELGQIMWYRLTDRAAQEHNTKSKK